VVIHGIRVMQPGDEEDGNDKGAHGTLLDSNRATSRQ
jgi:hypothetical protein